MKNPYSSGNREAVLEAYKEGTHFSEIAESTGLSYSTVQNYVYAAGLQHDKDCRLAQKRREIQEILDEYQEEFGVPFINLAK